MKPHPHKLSGNLQDVTMYCGMGSSPLQIHAKETLATVQRET